MPNLYDPNQGLLKAEYDPYAEYKNLSKIAGVNAAPVPSAAGSAAAQQAMIHDLMAIYSGTPASPTYKSPFNYDPSVNTDPTGGQGTSFEPTGGYFLPNQ